MFFIYTIPKPYICIKLNGLGILLNIETASKNCSVGVSNNGHTIALKEINDGGFTHAENLHNFIDDVLEKAQLTITDIDAVAVSKGPGSYTGLRIGVSAAKGICFAANKPLISVDTLKILASQLTISQGLIAPLIDARRMEVYSAVYNSQLELVRAIEAEILTETSFKKLLDTNKIYFLGDGALKCQTLLKHQNANYILDKFPSANEIGKLAEEKFLNKEFENVAYFEPFYLKDFISTTTLK